MSGWMSAFEDSARTRLDQIRTRSYIVALSRTRVNFPAMTEFTIGIWLEKSTSWEAK